MVHDHIFTKLFPNILLNTDLDYSSHQYLESLVKTPCSQVTVWRWCHRLGLQYCPKKKLYYVDGHKRPSQRFARKVFSKLYLTELELCFH